MRNSVHSFLTRNVTYFWIDMHRIILGRVLSIPSLTNQEQQGLFVLSHLFSPPHSIDGIQKVLYVYHGKIDRYIQIKAKLTQVHIISCADSISLSSWHECILCKQICFVILITIHWTCSQICLLWSHITLPHLQITCCNVQMKHLITPIPVLGGV